MNPPAAARKTVQFDLPHRHLTQTFRPDRGEIGLSFVITVAHSNRSTASVLRMLCAGAIHAGMAAFCQVPELAREPVADLVAEVMRQCEHADPGGVDMPIGWTSTYSMIVSLIRLACDPRRFTMPDGQHRLSMREPNR